MVSKLIAKSVAKKVTKKLSQKDVDDIVKKIDKDGKALDPTPSSPRSAIVQSQKYKKLQSNLEKEYDKTFKAYSKIKDKNSETAKLMRNKLNDMAKKLKGKKQIPMLPEGKAQGGMGLKTPTADQVGLKKLPTPVRNKMGYMYGGGMAKKPKMGNMDYRKGGLLLIAVDMMKKRKKGK